MNYDILYILACPICQKKLKLNKRKQELVCEFDSLIFPILKGIPVLLKSRAQILKK